jgi:uncharacterized protein YndB with AHSA1/START domain
MKVIEPEKVVGAVRREVLAVERDGKKAWRVVAERIYETDIDDTWDALTNASRIERWFMPVEGDLKLGGKYQLIGNAGGTITTCDPPKRLGLTWEMRGDASWVEVRLEVVSPERTRLVLEHTAVVPEEFWNQFGPGAVGVGWDLGLLGLALHIEDDSSHTRVEGEAWAASDEGKRVQAALSDEWAKAAILAGTPPADAHARAARVTAFYTGG